MKFKYVVCVVLGILSFYSCIKHEIVPAPTTTIFLTSKFTGVLDGISTEFSDSKDGYTCVTSQDKNLLTTPVLSSAIFYSKIASTSVKSSIRIGLGKLYWDAGVSAEPTLTMFQDFFNSAENILPPFKDDCSSGFNVQYVDENGTVFTSRDTSSQFQNVKFTNIKQESDASGDYSKFVCTFNCYVYYSSGPPAANGVDSVKIQNGQLKGWFKK